MVWVVEAVRPYFDEVGADQAVLELSKGSKIKYYLIDVSTCCGTSLPLDRKLLNR